MDVNRMKVNIGGTSYTLVSEESPRYMRDLAAQVDEAITAIVEADPRVSTTMAAVLAALESTDRANKEKTAADELRREWKKLADEREQIANALAAARAENERLQREVVQLRTRRP
ncbi:MAG: cell division protein ZapA [Clostridia bacterium]|nr:cell division protein ZapA [Clostridia bacterium]